METNLDKIYSAAIISIINALEECSTKETESIGLDNDVIIQLSSLNSRGQKYIAKHANKFISLKFNLEALNQEINEFNKYDQKIEQEYEFLLLGAPYHLMRDLFGLHASMFSLKRKYLGLFKQGQHRPFYCDEKTEHEIWHVWHEHITLDIRSRYLKVAHLTNQPINVIWTAIHRYSENSNDKR